jgi:hypothetical protein
VSLDAIEKLVRHGRLTDDTEVDWVCDRYGEPEPKVPSGREQKGALRLHQIGVRLSREDACTSCQGKSHSPFMTCVVSPVLAGCSFFSGACSNCLWHKKGSGCSFRKAGSFAAWTEALTE